MPDAAMTIRDLCAFYGYAQILHGVDLNVGEEPVAIVGRNGMGKTTFCEAMMGLVPRITGSVRLGGRELVGKQPHRIARAGIGYVPQGRRVFASLTTEEHLRLVAKRDNGWTLERIYDLFPRLAERRSTNGEQLSGGEQQMLVIARALLTDPKVLLLDEPSEGLAPTIVESLVETLRKLSHTGVAVVLIEQQLGTAAAVSDRLAVMVNGRIVTELDSKTLLSDEDAQQQYLGVGVGGAGQGR